MSHIQCKFLVSKFAFTKAVFSALAGMSYTSAGRLEVFWLLADLSMEQYRTTRHQIYNHGARRNRMSETGSRSNKWPSSHLANFVVYTSLLIRSIR